jgi:hypothetical protein
MIFDKEFCQREIVEIRKKYREIQARLGLSDSNMRRCYALEFDCQNPSNIRTVHDAGMRVLVRGEIALERFKMRQFCSLCWEFLTSVFQILRTIDRRASRHFVELSRSLRLASILLDLH